MIQQGAILITEVGGALVAAVALGEDRGTLDVLVPGGARQKLKSDKLVRVSAERVASPLTRGAAAVAEAEAWLVRVQAATAAIDMEGLWELLVDEEGAWSLADLADLAVPAGGALAADAMALALYSDRTWFKARKEGLVPNPRRTVEQVRAQTRAEAAARQEEEAAASGILAFTDGGTLLPDPPPTALDPWLRLLKDAALESLEGAREKKATALLERLFPGRAVGSAQAFDVLVRLGVFDVDQNLDLIRHRVQLSFPHAAEDEAARIAARPVTVAPERADLRHLGAVAIDDADTRDVDDALAVEDLPDGRAYLHVLIADVAELVHLESDVGAEARRRASSLYLPDQTIPMIPRALSEGQLSLEAGVDRLVLDFRLELDQELRVVGVEVIEGVTQVAARVTYAAADAALAGEEPSPHEPLLRRLAAIARALRDARRHAGALLLQQTEVKVKVTADGVRVERIDRASPSRALVAEAMIATCTHAAAFCHARGVPSVFRTQGAPDEPLELDEAQAGDPVLISEALRRMRKAELSLHPDRHYTLGADAYTQVTSPIRRYQDLVMHAQIKGALRHGVAPLGEREILHVFAEVESTAGIYTRMERDAKRYWILKHLQDRRGDVLDGVVLREQGKRFVVELSDLGIQAQWSPSSPVAPGSRVRLRVTDVDPRRDRLVLADVVD